MLRKIVEEKEPIEQGVLDALEDLLIAYDDETEELIPNFVFADSVRDGVDATDEDIRAIALGANGQYKVFEVVGPDNGFMGSTIISNNVTSEDYIKQELDSILSEDGDMGIELKEILPEGSEEAPKEEGDIEPDNIEADSTEAKEKDEDSLEEAKKKHTLNIDDVFDAVDDYLGHSSNGEVAIQIGDRVFVCKTRDLPEHGVTEDGTLTFKGREVTLDDVAGHGDEIFWDGDAGAEKTYVAKDWKIVSEENESLNEGASSITYYCISDGTNPRKSIIIPDGKRSRERAIQIAKANQPKYKYVSRFDDGDEVIIWHADDFDTKGMKVEESAEAHFEYPESSKDDVKAWEHEMAEKGCSKNLIDRTHACYDEIMTGGLDDIKELQKEGRSSHDIWLLAMQYAKEDIEESFDKIDFGNPFGLRINHQSIDDFDPESLVNKAIGQNESLHTNIMVRDSDNEVIVHTATVDLIGFDEPAIFVDVVSNTWNRHTEYGPDDFRGYTGDTTQYREVSKECGKGESGKRKAIQVLSEYKAWCKSRYSDR